MGDPAAAALVQVTSESVLVFGGSGMVGRSIVAQLKQAGHDVTRAGRHAADDVFVDVRQPPRLDALLSEHGLVVNAIGVLRGQADYPGDEFRLKACRVNAVWPLLVAEAAGRTGTRVVHISTDAVFAPADQPADEETAAEPVEPYGQSKLLGESVAPHVLNVRCSVIGPASDRGVGMWEWLVGQPPGTTIEGWIDHPWSGCTSRQLAHLVGDISSAARFSRCRSTSHAVHFAPNGTVPKGEVVQSLAARLRPDILVRQVNGPQPHPRPLSATSPSLAAVYTGDKGWDAALASAVSAGDPGA